VLGAAIPGRASTAAAGHSGTPAGGSSGTKTTSPGSDPHAGPRTGPGTTPGTQRRTKSGRGGLTPPARNPGQPRQPSGSGGPPVVHSGGS
jgi:hypothetical protein